MKSLWTVLVLATYFLIGETMELSGSKKMAGGKSFKKPTAPQKQEPNFNIFLRKVEIEDVEYGDYVSDKTHVEVVMFNESMPVISGQIHVLKDLPANLMIQISGYRFSATNQWMPVFDQGKHEYCFFVENNKSFVKNILIASDFKGCPIEMGVYTITNMVVDEKEFPPGVPDCKFKINVLLTSGTKKIATLRVFADVVQKDDDEDD